MSKVTVDVCNKLIRIPGSHVGLRAGLRFEDINMDNLHLVAAALQSVYETGLIDGARHIARAASEAEGSVRELAQ